MAKILPLKNETRKEAIYNRASELFKEKGYSATSMRNIAEAIGVEAPSLYNYISSKKEILQEICFKIAESFTTHLHQIELSDYPALKKLELLIRFHIYMIINEYQNAYVSEHEWKHLPEPHLSNFKDQRKNYRSRFANIIERGIINNEINEMHPSVAVLLILSAIGGIEYWHRSKKMVNAETYNTNN